MCPAAISTGHHIPHEFSPAELKNVPAGQAAQVEVPAETAGVLTLNSKEFKATLRSGVEY